MQEQVTHVEEGFGVGESSGLRLGVHRQAISEVKLPRGPRDAARDILLEGTLKRSDVGAERGLETFNCRASLGQHREEWSQLRPILSVFSQDEVVNESPGLGIKRTLLVALVVIRGAVFDAK